MDRTPHIDKTQEGAAKSTGKGGKAGLKSWEKDRYLYTKPINDKGPSHGDPRLECAPQSHGQHQDIIPSDGNPESPHPAFGMGAMLDLSARASTAIDQGTLAGGAFLSCLPGLETRSEPQHSPPHRPVYSGEPYSSPQMQSRLKALREGRAYPDQVKRRK
jgi:hypothetical protein